MKIGDLVCYSDRNGTMFGLITLLDPFEDGLHTEIFWTDVWEKSGMIISVWENDDFEVCA